MGEVLTFRRPLARATSTTHNASMYPIPVAASLLTDYSAHLRAAGLRPRTIRLRLDHARELILIGDPAVLDLTTLEIWVHPPDRAYSAETLRSRRASARRFLGWLHSTGRIRANPAADLHPIRVPPKPPRIIPDDAFARAIAHASDRDRAILYLARYGCLRLNEMAELRVEHRYGDRLTIDGKGGTVRHVWIAAEVQGALERIEPAARDGWYFPGRFRGHIHREALHKIIKRVTGGWNPHSLRHAGATAAYRGTRNLRGVQAMLGHASLATTQRYLTVAEEEMRALAQATRIAA